MTRSLNTTPSRLLALIAALLVSGVAMAQSEHTIASSDSLAALPDVSYTRPVSRVIAGLRVVGNESYEDVVVRNVSGLRVGQRVTVPGEEISQAVRNYLRNGLFSNVRIDADRMEGDSVWLSIHITERPRLTRFEMNGVKKSEEKDLRTGRLQPLAQGTFITPNILDRSEIEIKRFYDAKGFSNVEVHTSVLEDNSRPGYVVVIFDVNKNAKTKISTINFIGNEMLSDNALRRAMKKTNEVFNLSKRPWSSILEIFGTKKFVEKEYREDLKNILKAYHAKGYRDAEILRDTIYMADDGKKINIDIEVYEGPKYYIKAINFVGNTKYPTLQLQQVLGMRPGDVYNQKKLMERISQDEDAVSNLYSNNGYLFAYMVPVETEVKGDSVALDIRIHEGKPATINKVAIRGNSQIYDEVVRRELYTKPGMLFNRDYVMRSMRMIAQMGHFDQEKIVPNIVPHEESGTVDIEWQLTPKSNDQVQLSMGWSQTGLLLMAGLKFTNFSLRNLLDRSTYHNFLPRGDGQTLSLNVQTNARYYQSYGISFMDPWFGRKRPNMFSVSVSYSRQTDINRRFYSGQQQSLMNSYGGYGYGYPGYGYGGYGYGMGYPGGYGYGMGYPGGYGYGGMGGYGMGYYNQYYREAMTNLYERALDPDKTLDMLRFNIGYGKRLTWPDDNWQVSLGLTYNMYRMHNWGSYYYSFGMENGVANDINLSLNLARSSIDNPIYTRRGSSFTFEAQSTLPYSLWDGVDYSDPKLSDADRYRFIEYYKVKGKAQLFIPLMDPINTKRTPVLMASAESGTIGSFTPYKRSPFGTYYMGGDGMSSYYGYLNEMIGLRGYRNGSISGASGRGAYVYSKVFMELRYPVIFENQATIWVLGFAEAGNAWEYQKDFNPFQLKRSAGLGVRIMLPQLGLMGIDWGYGFDAPDGTAQIGGSNVHFVLGQQF